MRRPLRQRCPTRRHGVKWPCDALPVSLLAPVVRLRDVRSLIVRALIGCGLPSKFEPDAKGLSSPMQRGRGCPARMQKASGLSPEASFVLDLERLARVVRSPGVAHHALAG